MGSKGAPQRASQGLQLMFSACRAGLGHFLLKEEIKGTRGQRQEETRVPLGGQEPGKRWLQAPSGLVVQGHSCGLESRGSTVAVVTVMGGKMDSVHAVGAVKAAVMAGWGQ